MTPTPRVRDDAAFLTTARSLLFVPGDRPDRFAKAGASDADAIVLDLEDAVAPDAKPQAREHVGGWLRGHAAAHVTAVVRINAAGTDAHEDDVAAARRLGRPVMLPKAEDPAHITRVVRELGGTVPLVALIETAAGVLRAPEICAVPGVVRIAFGSVDLAAQLGVAHTDREAMRHARATLVLASAAAGLAPPVDGVTTAVDDPDAVRSDAAYARRLGLAGKLCVHPRQVPAVHEAFAPTREELRWAREVVASASDGAVTVLDGAMVDKPVVDRARRLLAAADPPVQST